eukprot:CAMPEP_0202439832 /NCGR_PEP_ID=MMETSP1345-20130828/36367_1 /ASSEMBLY_ACC=CAM_ASM_000843 /TAXON_ID=342563 /ORGANISM="Fabrea Fabrea salina" /LENGTH=615 /DNA_ID=CAMNT_0049054385 /DNA_START=993 /DNA_END=2841 /DNA_ORIENTATION=-
MDYISKNRDFELYPGNFQDSREFWVEGVDYNFVGFANKIGENNCFLNSCLQALAQVPHFQNALFSLRAAPGSLTKTLQEVFGEYFAKQGFDSSIDISELRLKFAEAFREAGEFQIGSTGDSMEALVSLLTLLHNEVTGPFNHSCMGQCPSHSAFFLRVLEETNCQCGSLRQIPWDYCSFLQTYNVNSILEQAGGYNPENLLNIQDGELHNHLEYSSLLSVEGQLPEFVKADYNSLMHYCPGEDYCRISLTRKGLTLAVEPGVYLIQLVWNKAGEFQIGSTGDSMEALVSLLTLLHNERFNSHTIDNSNTSCRNTCPSHKFFHLNILEELNCECGLKKKIPWNYSSFAHPFYVSSILEKAQEVDSKDLTRIREEDLEYYLEHSSLLSVEGQLPEFMKNQWEDLKEGLCSCLFGRTSKKMMLQNEPGVYLIQLVWNNSMPSALEILQVLASLPYTLSLDRIYLNGTQSKYNLRGMILYGCGHYIYCHRLNEGWLKLDDELAPRTKRTNWNILIKELLRCRLYPVGLFYYKESITLAPEMSILDWLKLEKEVIKAQAEYLQSVEPKPQALPNFIYQIVPKISSYFQASLALQGASQVGTAVVEPKTQNSLMFAKTAGA